MPPLLRHIIISLLLVLSLGLVACGDKNSKSQQTPATLNPGMRAYVDPVSGEYAPAPSTPTPPSPLVPAAGLTTPEAPARKEIPLPNGGVMIELGDQFQTEGRAAQ